MKVLFAVNNESISESIIKKYQQDYKEIISAKNVYYFNAIIKELQRDKTYDRIIISEDLEPFSSNNYDAIDKFIFEKMDNISDEATNQSGNDIPIILICSDRRTKSEALLIKLFGISVYNALIEKDRSITNVCELLKRPRTKKEAKVYYRIDSEDVDYKVENEADVSEVEIQNILNHYKKLGKNEDKYIESFNHIASQYTDAQLRLIAKFLPLNVKAVLEANSSKYQEIISFGNSNNIVKPISHSNVQNLKSNKVKNEQKNNEIKLDFIEKNLSKSKMTEPIIIPSNINTARVKKVEEVSSTVIQKTEPIIEKDNSQEVDNILSEISIQPQEKSELVNNELTETEEVLATQPKKRGRPKKVQTENIESNSTQNVQTQKKGRGRPKKVQIENDTSDDDKKIVENESTTSPVNLFELGEDTTNADNSNSTTYSDMILPGLDEEEMYMEEKNIDNIASNIEKESINTQNAMPEQGETISPNFGTPTTNTLENTEKYNLTNTNFNNILTRDKKVVAFVGTSKNGTSFLVNNLAEMFSQKGIKTALLDLTQNKNAYYIYTENEEELRKIAFNAIGNLRSGNPIGIEVNKNLTVYTTLPGENQDINDYSNILETLIKNYSLILLDCDFATNYGYFKEAQEIYLVQSLDILTIQPLTAFLRDLKAKNVLNPEKIRIALNKMVRVRSITERTIIGGMAFYNDPAMSFMTELFNKDIVPYCTIPFEEQTYSKYLEGLVNCKINLNGYSKNFITAFSKLGNMVYPLLDNKIPKQNGYNKSINSNMNNINGNFSNSMNDTLNKMKNNY